MWTRPREPVDGPSRGADAAFALWRATNLKLWLLAVVERRDDPLA
jgi:hypothetical protein